MPVLGVFAQGSAAKLYIPVKNVEASSMTTGFAVALAIAGNSFDGAQAVMPASGTAGNLPGWIGVANSDIASNAFGLVQCWGFAASVYISQQNTSVTINQGDPLGPGAAKGGLTSIAPTYAATGLKFVLASNVPVALSISAGPSYVSGLVRCL